MAGYVSSIKNQSVEDISSNDYPVLKLKKVAVMGKMTRYEFEKLRYDGFSEKQFKKAVCMVLLITTETKIA